jgi:hypothetical protein
MRFAAAAAAAAAVVVDRIKHFVLRKLSTPKRERVWLVCEKKTFILSLWQLQTL